MMARTLIAEAQSSTKPNKRTLSRLTATMTSAATRDGIQPGIVGHQYCTYTARAEISPTPAIAARKT